MFKLVALIAVVSIGLTVWCLVEAVAADERRVRGPAKPVWIVLLLLVPLVASVAWLLRGRPSAAAERAAAAADFAEFERPGRLQPQQPSDPMKDETYRRKLRERAEDQRRRHAQQQKRASGPDGD